VVDVAASLFHRPGPLLDAYRDYCNEHSRQRLDERTLLARFATRIKGLRMRVVGKFGKGGKCQEFSVACVCKESANEEHFTLKDGTDKTVAEYFRETERPLSRPELPCVRDKPPGKRGSSFPMEALEICPYQPYKVKGLMPSEMLGKVKLLMAGNERTDRSGLLGPRERFDAIQRELPDASRFATAYGAELGSQPAALRAIARELPKPVPREAERIQSFASVGNIPLQDWAVVGLHQDSGVQRVILDRLSGQASRMGLNVPQPSFYFAHNFVAAVGEAMRNARRPQAVLVILPGRKQVGDGWGAEATKECDIEHGVPSIKVRAETLLNRNLGGATLGNILMKINGKLGGVNRTVTTLPVIQSPEQGHAAVIGIDVSRPSGRCSIAGAVISLDDDAALYAGRLVELGRHEQEHLDRACVKDLIMKLLLARYGSKHVVTPQERKPARLVIYRDGVSEGGLPTVLGAELQGVIDACRELADDDGQPYRPRISLLVAQTAHNVRMFKVADDGRVVKAPAGTVVDTGAVNTEHPEFFLQSHEAAIGCARVPKYHVLWDENGLSWDDVESMTYALCWLYPKCNQSVSKPAPVYHADQICTRARHYMQDVDDGASIGGHSFGGSSGPELSLPKTHANVVHPNLQDVMYW